MIRWGGLPAETSVWETQMATPAELAMLCRNKIINAMKRVVVATNTVAKALSRLWNRMVDIIKSVTKTFMKFVAAVWPRFRRHRRAWYRAKCRLCHDRIRRMTIRIRQRRPR